MNYIKQINFFWEKAKRHSLSAGEIAMYMYLLHTSNVHDWENPVMEPNTTLQHAIGVKSFNTLKEIRNRLQQFELIKFRTRNGSSQVEYDLYDVELKTFARTSSKNEKVTDEVAAKVTDKVHDEVGAEVVVSVLLDNKQKPKPKALEQVQHGLFFEKFFSEDAEYDREQICMQIREQQIKREWCEIFNAHLHTERTEHKDYHSWCKHLRSWLPKKLPELKKGEAVQQQQKANKNYYN